MIHGTAGYFAERTRFERRLSIFMAAVAAVLLAIQVLLAIPLVRARVVRALPPLDPRRWGFEGPEQYVQRIVLLTSGAASERSPVVTYLPRQTLKGGRPNQRSSRLRDAAPETRRAGVGPGESPEDLLARARALYREAPVVQSEDLVIEQLVRPAYPEDALERNIEGRVDLVALIDTTGKVVRVDLMKSSGADQLDRAAADAVWKCRFRPYLQDGRLQEIYATFRYAFRIY